MIKKSKLLLKSGGYVAVLLQRQQIADNGKQVEKRLSVSSLQPVNQPIVNIVMRSLKREKSSHEKN